MNNRFALYEGCSLRSTGREYGNSMDLVFSRLGISLERPRDWSCCGSSSRISPDRLVSLALPLRNIASAGNEGFEEMLVPCAACFYRLRESLHELRKDENLQRSMDDVLGAHFEDKVAILHPLELLGRREYLELLGRKIAKPLNGIRAVCYYGCLISRAPDVEEKAVEYPQAMDRILRKTGIEILDWSYKTECCGASLTLTRPAAVTVLCNRIAADARERGADLIAVACPMCQNNLDMRQSAGSGRSGAPAQIPVLYFTELLGLALGIEARRLSLQKHFVNVGPLLERAGREKRR
jgi:heterodisulfide reductase subunit B2